MYSLPNQPSGIFEILDDSLKLYLACFTRLIGYGLIASALSFAIGFFSERLMPTDIQSPEEAGLALIQSVSSSVAIDVILSLPLYIFYVAMIFRIENIVQGREDSFIEGLWVGLRKLPAIVLAGILFTIAFFIGTLPWVVPGIILSISMSFAIYFIILEDAGSYASLIASHRLVWGDWWRTNAVFFVPGLVAIIALAILIFISEASGQAVTSFYGATQIVIDLLLAVIMPYFFVLGYVQYRDLKLRKMMQ